MSGTKKEKKKRKKTNKLLNKSDKEWRICFLFFNLPLYTNTLCFTLDA